MGTLVAGLEQVESPKTEMDDVTDPQWCTVEYYSHTVLLTCRTSSRLFG